jgi:hypothetical protein
MIEQVLRLEPDDNVITVADQVGRLQAARAILVVPPDSALFTRRLDLQRIARLARSRRMDLALVTRDPDISEHARDLDVPVFTTLERAQGRRWRWPWQALPPGRLDPRAAGARRRPFLGEEDMGEMRRRRARRLRFRWALRLAAIAVGLLTLAIAGSLAYLAVPGARVTLVPASEELAVAVAIVAAPGLEQVDYSTRQVPARVVQLGVEGSASISATGIREVPDQAATGTVLFTNLLPQEVRVPEGTPVRTTSGTPVRFVTTQAVVVPAGGQASAPVRAVDPGPEGNVDEQLINRVEGAPGLALRVINIEPTDGGSARAERAVTQVDRDALKQILLKELLRQAMVDMTAGTQAAEFVTADSLRVVSIDDESYDRFVGEQAGLLNLDMRVVVEGVIVDEQAARALVYDALRRKGGQSYELVPSSLRFRRGEVTSVDGRGAVTFYMQGWAARIARLDLAGLTDAIRGRPLVEARAILAERLALEEAPEIAVWPEGFERMPYLAFRIHTDVIAQTGPTEGD